ncbi:MAG: UvrB/UvrC motif-containing protein, partial [Alphaproteobacteria bacterium]
DRVTVGTGDEEMGQLVGKDLKTTLADLQARMLDAASNLEFEEAGRLRDEIKRLEAADLALGGAGASLAVEPEPKRQRGKRAGKNEQRRTKEAAYNPLEKVVGPVKRKR